MIKKTGGSIAAIAPEPAAFVALDATEAGKSS
jgi:hypothetical protein